MVICTEPMHGRSAATAGPASGQPLRDRWEQWTSRWGTIRESVDSEWSAAYEALSAPGTESTRKWLGWALYRLAARVNPDVRD